MSTVKLITDAEQDPRVRAVFDDIRATRKSDFINNFWLYLAFDPQLLEETWFGVKAVMAVPSALDPLTKELVYIAVSITNSCRYCVHSHTAAARARGMTDDMYADLLRVVATAGRTKPLQGRCGTAATSTRLGHRGGSMRGRGRRGGST
jgi:AhpD family alkylhydroperoxidase